jgi:hypothetical protein
MTHDSQGARGGGMKDAEEAAACTGAEKYISSIQKMAGKR